MNRRDNSVGEALREARLAKGMTQSALGAKLGYSAMAVSHFENGTRPIRLEELRRASDILGCDLAEHSMHKSSPVLFRASNVRGGTDAIARSLQSFDKFIDKKYGNNSGAKKSD